MRLLQLAKNSLADSEVGSDILADMSDTDLELLARYTRQHAEDAFAELVRRHIGLVYSAALRQVRSPPLAEEVAQSAFIDLARQAARLKPDTILTAWLYQVTRRTAIDVVRREVSRQLREQIATEMNAMNTAAADWTHIEPLLDQAMHALDDTDRAAVLLRYFENKSLREVGATLGTSENAAQKRLARAVERLREFFAKRGVTVGASGLVVVISANAVQVAPIPLATALTSASLAGATAASGPTFTLLKLMAVTKLKVSVVGAVIVAGVLVALLLQREKRHSTGKDNSPRASASETAAELAGQSSGRATSAGFPRREQNAAPPLATPEAVVAGRLSQYGRSRRDLVHALAQRHGVEVPDDVKRFFDAVEAGNWDEIAARFKVLAGTEPNSSASASGRQPGLEKLWAAIIDAYGAAEQTHLWPAQQLLDYGNAALGSLRPGMVYVGGSDNGRWIAEMLNDTSNGERHVVITQNGLADATYLDYISVRYGDRLNMVTEEDSRGAFQNYVADAQKRLQHDKEFPDEPKQVRQGEDIQVRDGKAQVSGTVAVMAINERILQALMQKNPGLSFAAQESFPMKGTYADAIPLGPLMELRADGQNTFTADRAAQSLDYWRTTAQQVLSDPLASGSSVTLGAYSHDVNAAANLLAAHNFNAEAEQAYRLASQLMPSNIEAAFGLSGVLVRAGRTSEARQILDDFSRNYPDQKRAIESTRASFLWTAPSEKASN
jgi:RNA polymerase sigma factor (sigma-70 family)